MSEINGQFSTSLDIGGLIQVVDPHFNTFMFSGTIKGAYGVIVKAITVTCNPLIIDVGGSNAQPRNYIQGYCRVFFGDNVSDYVLVPFNSQVLVNRSLVSELSFTAYGMWGQEVGAVTASPSMGGNIAFMISV